MQTPEWEENDSLDLADAAARAPAATNTEQAAREKVHILELRRRHEERLDSKRIEMEYGYDYLDDDESIQ